MHEPSHAFLKKLLETPSPSGYERPVQDVVRAWAADFADEVGTDRHGNVIAVRHPVGAWSGDHAPTRPIAARSPDHATPGAGEPPRVMLAGHCDQIGLMV